MTMICPPPIDLHNGEVEIQNDSKADNGDCPPTLLAVADMLLEMEAADDLQMPNLEKVEQDGESITTTQTSPSTVSKVDDLQIALPLAQNEDEKQNNTQKHFLEDNEIDLPAKKPCIRSLNTLDSTETKEQTPNENIITPVEDSAPEALATNKRISEVDENVLGQKPCKRVCLDSVAEQSGVIPREADNNVAANQQNNDEHYFNNTSTDKLLDEISMLSGIPIVTKESTIDTTKLDNYIDERVKSIEAAKLIDVRTVDHALIDEANVKRKRTSSTEDESEALSKKLFLEPAQLFVIKSLDYMEHDTEQIISHEEASIFPPPADQNDPESVLSITSGDRVTDFTVQTHDEHTKQLTEYCVEHNVIHAKTPDNLQTHEKSIIEGLECSVSVLCAKKIELDFQSEHEQEAQSIVQKPVDGSNSQVIPSTEPSLVHDVMPTKELQKSTKHSMYLPEPIQSHNSLQVAQQQGVSKEATVVPDSLQSLISVSREETLIKPATRNVQEYEDVSKSVQELDIISEHREPILSISLQDDCLVTPKRESIEEYIYASSREPVGLILSDTLQEPTDHVLTNQEPDNQITIEASQESNDQFAAEVTQESAGLIVKDTTQETDRQVIFETTQSDDPLLTKLQVAGIQEPNDHVISEATELENKDTDAQINIEASEEPDDQVNIEESQEPDDQVNIEAPEEPDDQVNIEESQEPDDQVNIEAPEEPDDQVNIEASQEPDDQVNIEEYEKTDDQVNIEASEEPDNQVNIEASKGKEPDDQVNIEASEEPDDQVNIEESQEPDDQVNIEAPEEPDDQVNIVASQEPDDQVNIEEYEKTDDQVNIEASEEPDNQVNIEASKGKEPDDQVNIEAFEEPDDQMYIESSQEPDDQVNIEASQELDEQVNIESSQEPDDQANIDVSDKPYDKVNIEVSEEPDGQVNIEASQEPDDQVNIEASQEPVYQVNIEASQKTDEQVNIKTFHEQDDRVLNPATQELDDQVLSETIQELDGPAVTELMQDYQCIGSNITRFISAHRRCG